MFKMYHSRLLCEINKIEIINRGDNYIKTKKERKREMWNIEYDRDKKDGGVITEVSKAISSGYSNFNISVIIGVDDYTSMLYKINEEYMVLPSISSDGSIEFDILNVGETPRIYDDSDIDEAREFLSLIFNNMITSICDKNKEMYFINGYKIPFKIIEYYRWFNFKSAFFNKGYLLCISNTDEFDRGLYMNLLDDKDGPVINDTYKKYHDQLKDVVKISEARYNECRYVFPTNEKFEIFKEFLKSVGIPVIHYTNIVILYWITGYEKFVEMYKEFTKHIGF